MGGRFRQGDGRLAGVKVVSRECCEEMNQEISYTAVSCVFDLIMLF